MIQISGLKKSFGKLEVLKDINMEIEDGTIYGLVGRSGAGKSTLLRCINGLETYNSGSLKVDGVEVKDLNKKQIAELRKDMGMIFQNFSLITRRNVYDNIALPMRCWKYDKSKIDKRVKELVEMVGIADKLYEKPGNLSGGQKQRVAIARALAMEPKVLLCDEATSALDPKTSKDITDLLIDINKQLNLTMIVVTHQMSVVRDLCDQISILENGCLSATGSVEDIFMHQPPAFKRLIGEEEYDSSLDGVDLKIYMSASKVKEPIISELTKKFDENIVVIGGKMENYKNKLMGSLIINVSKEKAESILSYLENEKQYIVEVLQK